MSYLIKTCLYINFAHFKNLNISGTKRGVVLKIENSVFLFIETACLCFKKALIGKCDFRHSTALKGNLMFKMPYIFLWFVSINICAWCSVFQTSWSGTLQLGVTTPCLLVIWPLASLMFISVVVSRGTHTAMFVNL